MDNDSQALTGPGGGNHRYPEERADWLLTFTDLVCLVLTFFVMSYAMSTPRHTAWRAMTSGLSTRLNPAPPSPEPTGAGAAFNIGFRDAPRAMSIDYLAQLLSRHYAGSEDLSALPPPQRRDDRLVLSLPVDRLFVEDLSYVSIEGRTRLDRLGEMLGRIDNRLDVTGIVDPDPDDAEAFRQRWELALHRARVLADVLSAAGYRRPVVARAAADPAWSDRPGAPRRLEIVIRDTGER